MGIGPWALSRALGEEGLQSEETVYLHRLAPLPPERRAWASSLVAHSLGVVLLLAWMVSSA